jgi:hypothetical protein
MHISDAQECRNVAAPRTNILVIPGTASSFDAVEISHIEMYHGTAGIEDAIWLSSLFRSV